MLSLLSKNPVKFVVSDQLAETAVVLSPDDDEETLVSKLQRVIELAGGQLLPVRQPGAALQAAVAATMAAEPLFTPADRAATDERLAATAATMGWAEDGPDIDNLPEIA
jgi:hypothetical protein